MEESLFVHENNGKKEWLIGLIDVQTRKKRLGVVF